MCDTRYLSVPTDEDKRHREKEGENAGAKKMSEKGGMSRARKIAVRARGERKSICIMSSTTVSPRG